MFRFHVLFEIYLQPQAMMPSVSDSGAKESEVTGCSAF